MKITATDTILKTRAGSIVILVALLLPMIIALVAFAVDYGVIVVARQELQNAADAAATATLETLASDPDLADLAAFETITANSLLGSPIDFDMERTVHYGNWDADTMTFVEIPRDGGVSAADFSGSSIPNGATAVMIRLTRSRALGNGIQLFFAPVIGANFAEIEVEAIAAHTPGCSGFVGLESIDLRNNLITDSYNSDLGEYESGSGYDDPNANRFANGNVCSNGSIFLASGADVFGNAQGSSITIAQGSGASISGSQSETGANRNPEPVDFNEANINDNETIERGPVWAPEYVRPNGDLVVNNGRVLTLDSGTYSFNNVTVTGGGQLRISGEVQIFAQGKVQLDNGTNVNPSRVPRDFQLFVGDGPVNIQGGNGLHGVIYAPEASVTIANGSGFFGSILGKKLSVAGGAGLHFDESLADDEETGGPPRLVH